MVSAQPWPRLRLRLLWTIIAAFWLAVGASEQSKCAAPGCASGFQTQSIIVGGWQLLERHKDPSDAVATLLQYAEANFTTFDTADIYGPSESILGQFRSAYSTKFGAAAVQKLIFHTKYVTQDSSLRNARAVNQQSTTALGTTPDLVQFHWWNFADSAFVNTAAHLAQLRTEGALKEIGLCNFDTARMRQVVEAQVPVVANQVQYSLLDRRPENGMLQLAAATDVQLLCFGAVAGGWLSDKFLGAPASAAELSRSATVSMRMYRRALMQWSAGSWDLFQELLRSLRVIADTYKTSIAAVAMAWVLTTLNNTGVGGAVILGVRDASHLQDAITARSLRLTAVEMQSLKSVLDQGAPPQGDIWSHERS